MDAILNVISTTSEKLFDIPITDGNLIFLQDHSTIALDIQSVRKLYSNIEKINSSQKSDMKISGFYYCVDTNILWQFDGEDWIQITRSASEEEGVVVINGTIENNVIVSKLGNGIFSVSGQYRITPEDGVNITFGRELFIVSNNEVHHVNGKEITKYTITNDGVKKDNYLTSADFSEYIKRDEAETIIQQLISEGVEEEVIEVILQSLATDQDIEHLFDN